MTARQKNRKNTRNLRNRYKVTIYLLIFKKYSEDYGMFL